MDEDIEEPLPQPPQVGSAAFTLYRDDLLTAKELAAWRRELREREARRIPLGFRDKMAGSPETGAEE